MKFDKKDVEILKILQTDGRMSTAEIAEKVNMSQSPCWRRINQFERDGVIKNKVNLLDRSKLGMDMVVFTSINLVSTNLESIETFEREIVNLPEVVECYTMTGMIDYMLKIVTRDIQHYEQFVRSHLALIPNIRETHSHVSVTEIKDTSCLPLETQL
ncbi:Lrp/AsnC family transcriptional regulator [Agarilytica rhodophyticola]|uniref:Lrp/AsnC family transcriptional regulator n=1 Tax=Agarilytica rhodophyticola TaxID=1737490 RepID=UPI000B347CD3|nr:Lrp/AsnC family transcriptional regulator [Agarilytica rhodophyticola]